MLIHSSWIAPLLLLAPVSLASDNAGDIPKDNSRDIPTSISGAAVGPAASKILASAQNGAQLSPKAENEESKPVERKQGWLSLDAMHKGLKANQVRIEQRVIIRVAPVRTRRQSLVAELPQQGVPSQLVEKKIGKCLPLKGIAAVQADKGSRLLLFMRDKRIITANLEKACAARDFYSGFYLERSKDGNLCVNRDRLQSRTGVKCKLGRIRQLVRYQT